VQDFQSSALPTELPAEKSREQGILECRGFCASKFSRAIDLDRLDLAAVTMHVDSDWTTTNFAILDRGKGAE
jgi:hypothetical protein